MSETKQRVFAQITVTPHFACEGYVAVLVPREWVPVHSPAILGVLEEFIPPVLDGADWQTTEQALIEWTGERFIRVTYLPIHGTPWLEEFPLLRGEWKALQEGLREAVSKVLGLSPKDQAKPADNH